MTRLTWSVAGYEAVGDILRARTGLSFAPNRYPQAEEGIRRAKPLEREAAEALISEDPRW